MPFDKRTSKQCYSHAQNQQECSSDTSSLVPFDEVDESVSNDQTANDVYSGAGKEEETLETGIEENASASHHDQETATDRYSGHRVSPAVIFLVISLVVETIAIAWILGVTRPWQDNNDVSSNDCQQENTTPTAQPSHPPTFNPTECKNTSSAVAFETTQELYDAVDRWLEGDILCDSDLAATYGYPIGKWNVSQITNLSHLFSACSDCCGANQRANPDAAAFNNDISKWNVSHATTMQGMFCGAQAFHGNLSLWDVSSVTDMSWMFAQPDYLEGFHLRSLGKSTRSDSNSHKCRTRTLRQSRQVNQDYYYGLSHWDVSNVIDMSWMFAGASFNGDLSGWNVSSVKYMHHMFDSTRYFNGDISNWDVSSVTNMSSMFHALGSFNAELSAWNVFNVVDMSAMFYNASSFNADLSKWNVSHVANISYMFNGADSFDQDLCEWGLLLSARTCTNAAFNNSGCPESINPDLCASPPGPFCHACTLD